MKLIRQALLASALAVGCGPPKVAPLVAAAPANVHLPHIDLPPNYRLVRFTWTMADGNIGAQGDGVARIAPPDSARVDLFVRGPFGGGASAIALGDSVFFPPRASMTELIPPPPMLWATLGRLAIPALPDTIIRVAGDTISAAIGRPEQWRVVVVAGRLVRVERLEKGRIVEWVDRSAQTHIRYESTRHLSLVLELQKDSFVPPFDASIWRY